MITTFYPPSSFGGDGIHIYRLSNELARRGHHVDVICCEDSYLLLQSSGSGGGYANHPNVQVHKLKSRAGLLSPLLTQQTGMPFFKKRRIKEILEGNHYDVIHYHNMSLIGITVLQYGRAIKLYTMNEHWLVCPMHVLWKFNREVCTKKSCMLCQIAGERPPQLWRYSSLLNRMLENVDHFISPSRFTLRKHLELGLQIPITHIPYFLPQTSPHEQSDDHPRNIPPNNRPYFLFVGRLEKIKGLQNLIPVFRTHPKYDLLVAGEGGYGSVLKTLAADVPNIKFLGKLDHERLQRLYRDAIAVIVPSLCYEVFGIIIIESFSMKTPVIVNNLGALPEVVEDSHGGFTYSNENELLHAMEQLAKDTDLRDTLGSNGYLAYLKYWTEDRHLEKYMNLIDALPTKNVSLAEVPS